MNNNDTILVVDDDQAVRVSVVEILENEGYVVDIAINGQEAINKIRNFLFNLVILDVRLPDISGIQLLSQINECSPRMKKIVLTGFPDTETAITSVNEKADAYLVKPFNPEELVKIISINLEKQKKELNYTQEKVLEYIKNRVKELDNVSIL